MWCCTHYRKIKHIIAIKQSIDKILMAREHSSQNSTTTTTTTTTDDDDE
jgi:hypothetical protein